MRNFDTLPDYKYGRLVLTDDAAGGPAGSENGWNFRGYEYASFVLIPVQNPPANGDAFFETGDVATLIGTPTSNPAVEVYYFSPQARLWLKQNPAQTFTAAGAGIATVLTVNVHGRQTALKITGVTATQGVVIYAGGFGRWNLE